MTQNENHHLDPALERRAWLLWTEIKAGRCVKWSHAVRERTLAQSVLIKMSSLSSHLSYDTLKGLWLQKILNVHFQWQTPHLTSEIETLFILWCFICPESDTNLSQAKFASFFLRSLASWAFPWETHKSMCWIWVSQEYNVGWLL